MTKCAKCDEESQYLYHEVELCSACVTVMAKRIVKNYFASEHDGADHKLVINGDIISIVTSHA